MHYELIPAKEDDRPALAQMLEAEGVEPLALEMEGYTTYILRHGKDIAGFFTYRIDHELFPHVFYFLVAKEFRDNKTWFTLIRKIREMMWLNGYTKIIFHALEEKPRLEKLLRWYTHSKPYGEIGGDKYFLMEA